MPEQGNCRFRGEAYVYGLKGELGVRLVTGATGSVVDDGSLTDAAVRSRLELAASILGVQISLRELSGCKPERLLDALLDGLVSAILRLELPRVGTSARVEATADNGKIAVTIFGQGMSPGLEFIYTPKPKLLRVNFNFPPAPLVMSEFDGPLGIPNTAQQANIRGNVKPGGLPSLCMRDMSDWIEGPTRALRGRRVLVQILKVPTDVVRLDEPGFRAFIAALQGYFLKGNEK